MLNIFSSKPLDQAFSVTKYKELIDKTYEEILLFEIEANVNSYTKNMRITEAGTRKYARGVGLTTIAILISMILLLSDKFISIENVPAKVQVVNMSKIPLKNLVIDSLSMKNIQVKK